MAAVATGMAIGSAVKSALDTIDDHVYQDNDVFVVWNDQRARDERARIEKTYKRGRFSYARIVLNIEMGRWYGCYKQEALENVGQPLDDEC